MPATAPDPERTSPEPARVLLHAAHLVTFMVLLVSGVLLFVPDLRAAITGGYSLVIRKTHCWVGVTFVVVPVLIVLRYGIRTTFASPERRTARTVWQGLHVAITVAMGILLTLSGFVLWGKALVGDPVVEASRIVHDWLTYGAAGLLGIHLAETAVAAVVARITSSAATVAGPRRTGKEKGTCGVAR